MVFRVKFNLHLLSITLQYQIKQMQSNQTGVRVCSGLSIISMIDTKVLFLIKAPLNSVVVKYMIVVRVPSTSQSTKQAYQCQSIAFRIREYRVPCSVQVQHSRIRLPSVQVRFHPSTSPSIFQNLVFVLLLPDYHITFDILWRCSHLVIVCHIQPVSILLEIS